jgi:GNAT superfamily N-acetyltransferase
MDEASLQLLSRIEDASINASAAPQQRWLDGWILRYCPGKARRSRCVNAVATGRLPVAQKLELAAALFREFKLPMVIRITAFTQPACLDAELQAMGWPVQGPTRVRVLHDPAAVSVQPLPAGCRWTALDGPTFAEAVGQLRSSPVDHRQSHARRLAESPVPYQGYAIVREADGAVLACGQFAREGDLVGLYDIHTRDDVRGQGLASRLCERLLTVSVSAGAKISYLQVEADNHPAQRVYSRLGFVDGYDYHYREQPGA